jgi:hypothetical protein
LEKRLSVTHFLTSATKVEASDSKYWSACARVTFRGLRRDSLRMIDERSSHPARLAEPKLALRSVASEGWLAVRDDFRNWVIRAA